MTFPVHHKVVRAAIVAATVAIPAATQAEQLDITIPVTPMSFSGLGAPDLDALPLELSNDSAPKPVAPRLEIVDLGTTPMTAPVPLTTPVEVRRKPRRVMQNTWTIGVFR